MLKNDAVRSLVYAAMCLALCMFLPLLIGNVQVLGQSLSPMHIPVFLCGFLCGWPYAGVVGFLAPILRSLMFGMPAMFPGGISMAFELAAYGIITSLLYRLLPKKTGYLYLTLISAMLAGRFVWGCARWVIAGFGGTAFTFEMFLAGAFTNAVVGIILHIAIIPPIVLALKKAKIMRS